MKIQLNGIKETIPEELTIKALIEWAKEGDPHLIVEQNGKYIYPSAYDSHPVLKMISLNLSTLTWADRD
nr:sulfur carrier protein ThiS [Desulfobacula sp.]